MKKKFVHTVIRKRDQLKWVCITLFSMIVFSSCTNKAAYNPPADPLFTKLDTALTGVSFINTVKDDSAFNVITYRNFYNGGGVATGDINNDGLADIFFTANQGENHLYLNKGNLHFEDITLTAGIKKHQKWSTGVTMADVNADGLLDIYVCAAGEDKNDPRNNELYINKGNLHFEESAAAFGLQDSGAYHTQAAFFDYDLDGDLDVYLLNNNVQFPINNFSMSTGRQMPNKVLGNKLLQNNGGYFTDVSKAAGIYESNIGFGLGVVVSDINGDHWPDIYVSNDFFEKDYLYINQKDGTYKEVSDDALGHVSQSSMGADIADINNDGLPDIISTDMLPEDDYRLKKNTSFDDFDVYNAKKEKGLHYQMLSNMLHLNNGNNTFSEIARFAGVGASDWSWGALIFDINNDGWKDITVCNGMYLDVTDQDYIDFIADENNKRMFGSKGNAPSYEQVKKMLVSTPIPNYQFINQKNLQLQNQSYNLGLGEPGYSNGAAYADLDNDGDMDLVINNLNSVADVFRNNANEKLRHNYLHIKFAGDSANRFGIGAEVALNSGNLKQVSQNYPTRGFQSSVEPSLIFGLDTNTLIDSLVISWPGNKMQIVKNVAVNKIITLNIKDANEAPALQLSPIPLLQEVTEKNMSGNIRHRENLYVDFNTERLIPHLVSTEGPKIAIGDVNGDKLEDFFIGSAKYDTAKIFIQTADGRFKSLKQPAFEADNALENIGAQFMDTDNDGDLDLIVASGGNADSINSSLLQPRLYINNGKGTFTKSDAFPKIFVNASCVTICDFNNDGWKDMFIGGRVIPGAYGKPASSFLLQNINGVFTDVTKSVAPGLINIGMVTDAVWEDTDNDNIKDLIVVGEWMPVTIFKNSGRQLSLSSLNKQFTHSSGWWNCIKAADLDGDGDIDFVAGNLGLNTKLKANEKHPAQMYTNDYDNNGTIESLITYYKKDGKSYPYYSKSDLFLQLPFLKKKFLNYKDYAGKTMNELFDKSQLDKSVIKEVYQLQSCMFINDGKGNFLMRPLPSRAQFAPVYSILIDDFNGDKIPDLLLAGNLYGFKPELVRNDADYGTLLTGDGKLNYNYIPLNKAGVFYKGEARDIKKIITADKRATYLLALNNVKLKIFKATSNSKM